MNHYQRWQHNKRLLRAAGISSRNVSELEQILLGTSLSVVEGLVELGVATGYLSEEVFQAVLESLSIEMNPNTGVWV